MAVRAVEPPVTVIDAVPRASVLSELVRFSRRNALAALGGVVGAFIIFVLVNVLVDLSYAWLDPRIRFS